MADNHRRKKVYLGSADRQEKADDTHLVRKLIKAVFEKGLERVKAGKDTPDSFKHLFGEEAIITPAVRGHDADAFRFASKPGAIHNREQLLLNVLSGKMEAKITSTDGIKESLLSNIHCISAVDNPVDLVAKSKEG